MQIKHIFFDLDHTLWDFETNSEIAFAKILPKLGITCPVQDFIAVYNPINIKYWDLYQHNIISKETLRYRRIKDSFEVLNKSISEELINKISFEYIEELPKSNLLFPDTISVLQYLKNKYTLHIITNGFHDVQVVKLKGAKIDSYFQHIIDSDSIGVKKPDPRIFNYALQKAKAKAEESLMIGDNINVDIEGAKNVSMNVILCNFNDQDIKSNVPTIPNLKALIKIL